MDKKHKIVLAACIAVGVLLIGVSAAVYGHYKHEQQAKANHNAQVSAAQAKSQENAKKVFAYQLYLNDLQCARDIAAAQKAKTALPVCNAKLQPIQ